MDNFWYKYPRTDFHEMNLDWLLATMRKLEIEFDEFKVVNNITFSGPWDITKQYPAWTIVNDNDIGYVSIQPVPAGVVLTNTDYWVSVIDYSAQIAGLQNRVVALETTVGDASSGLVHDVDVCEADIDNIEDVVYKKYAILGDSYCDPTVSGNNTSIATEFMSLMGLTENVDCAVTYAGGYGFISDGAKTFESLLTTLYNKVLSSTVDFTPAQLTDLIVLGGDNDAWHTQSDLDAAITVFVSQAKIYFPNATIHIGEVGNVKANATNHQNIALYTIPAYQNSIKDGAHYLSGVETVMLRYNEMYTSDNIHPNGTGMRTLAGAVKQALYSKYEYSTNQTKALSLTGNDMGSTTTNINVTAIRHNETIDITMNGDINSPNTVNSYTTKILGTIPDNLFQGTMYNCFGYALIKKPDNSFSHASIYIEGSMLKIITGENMPAGTWRIVFCHFTLPSYYN